MTARPPTTDPDPRADARADAYRRALDGPPRPDHVDELKRLGLPIPRTQGEASAALTSYYVAMARCVEVGR